mmetsp:Transcript_14209/g.36312  ORF Transcript_14209/g.36312 Transcript_14209/m.36312 type:complete len:451 (-) Transcript_14209:38-1390(-)
MSEFGNEVSVEGSRPRRKRRRSRKGKKEFRKNIDADATSVVSARRRAAVSASLAFAPDSDLFFIDKNAHAPTRKELREKARTKKLSVDRILDFPKTAGGPAPPVVPRQFRQGTATKKGNASRTEELRIAAETRKLERKLRQQKKGTAPQEHQPLDPNRFVDPTQHASYDLWAEAPPKPTRKRRKAAKLQTKSDAPAVEVPGPGHSYHPSYEDHQDALGEAVADELERLQKQEKIIHKLTISNAVRRLPKRMHIEVAASSDEEGDDEDDSTPRYSVVDKPPAIRPPRKTRTERNKELRQREEKKAIAKKKESNKLNRQVDRIPATLKAIDAEEQRRSAAAEYQEQQKSLKKAKKLGKHRLEAPIKEVTLTNDLPSSMREIRAVNTPGMHPIKERFYSIQNRELIEPRSRANRRRRYEKKLYQKRTAKVALERLDESLANDPEVQAALAECH